MARKAKPEKRRGRAPEKKKNVPFKSGFADLNFVQAKIMELRSTPAYQTAEAQRQTDGSGTMASGSASQQQAIRLMIQTWESIANLVMAIDRIGREAVFGTTPIGYMYDALEAGILIIRQNDPGYASMFEQLDQAYSAWLSSKPADYQSRAAQGLNANFG